jgi:hypothetical protein
MDELVLGFEARPRQNTFLRIAAIGRLEQRGVGAVNIGVPESSYTLITVPDMGIDVVGAGDDQFLASTTDRRRRSGPTGISDQPVGPRRLVCRRRHDRHGAQAALLLPLGPDGGALGRARGQPRVRAARERRGSLGEVFVNPNARVYAQGRLFTERGYTIKLASSYEFPRDLTFGLIGRYQDGQHFARLVVMDGLNQGAEANRAFRNGRTRFTFTMTVDARLQKGFTVGGHTVTAFVDAYNLFNQYLQIEEIAVSGATSRQTSAIQPPIAVHVGVRISL